MFSQLLERLRPLSFEEVTNSRLHEIISAEVESHLLPLGFKTVSVLKWVNDQRAPIRCVFTMQKWKNGTVTPNWGVSLDFVPHISGGKIRWHKTNKSSMLDLRVDPHDNSLKIPYYYGERPIREKHRKVIRSGIKHAEKFWSRCEEMSSLLQVIDWLKSFYGSKSWPHFYTYNQHSLAVAFVLAKMGYTAEALKELDRLNSDPWRIEVVKPLKDLIVSGAASALS